MRTVGIKIIFSIFLLGLSFLQAQNMFAQLKEKTINLFLEELNLERGELEIVFNHLPKNLEKYKTSSVKVYSQKRIVKPGTQAVWAQFSRAGKNVKKLPLNITVTVIKNVVVAGERINRGRAFSYNNLILEKRRLGKDWDRYFFKKEDVLGAESKQLIKKGVLLTRRMVIEPQLVHSGQQVNIQIRSGNLTISTKGTAKQNGAKDDEIKLRLDKTGKIIRGVVASKNLVIVLQE
jgi:flagella basal body P-ring formation protein FlgA